MFRYFFVIFLLLLFISCGGQEDYTDPMVVQGDVYQSGCKEISGFVEESFEVIKKDNSFILKHKNMYLPEQSIAGILDVDGDVSFKVSKSLYYLEASDTYINISEYISMANSEKWCYYDFTIKVTNISGGEYDIFLWGHNKNKLYEDHVTIR